MILNSKSSPAKANLHKCRGHADDAGVSPPTAEVCRHHHKHRRALEHVPNLGGRCWKMWQIKPAKLLDKIRKTFGQNPPK